MSLRFAGTTVPGIVQPYAVPARGLQVRRVHFFGVLGESQITGAPGGRTLQIPMLVFEDSARFSSRAKLASFLASKVETLQGKVGDLQIILGGGTGDIYPECCLDNCVTRANPGIVEDEAGLLGGGFFCEVDFTFRQL